MRELRDIEIKGYYPGVVGKITELHAVYYYENWGFDVTFETQVGGEFSDFVRQFDGNRDGLWVAVKKGEFAGAIAIDGVDAFGDGGGHRVISQKSFFSPFDCFFSHRFGQVKLGDHKMCRRADEPGFGSLTHTRLGSCENSRPTFQRAGIIELHVFVVAVSQLRD